MKKHPKAGMPVLILSGPYKGQHFLVIEYLVNQFQGKSIDKIVKAQANLVSPLVMRGVPVDEKTVFGQLYPAMTFMVLPEEELIEGGQKIEDKVADTENVVIPFAPKDSNVTPITNGKKKSSKKVSKKGGKDDTTGSSKEDN